MNKEVLRADISKRINRLQQSMKLMQVDACVVCTPVNVFYLSGLVYNGYLYVPQKGNVIHFVKRPQVDLPDVVPVYKPELILDYLKFRGLDVPQTLLLELDVLSYNSINRLISSFQLPMNKVQDVSYLMRRLRSEKTDFEIEQIRECAKKHIEVYKMIPSLFREGMTDIELQIKIEEQMRLHGSIGIFRSYGENMDIYMGSLLVGDNARVASPFDFALGGRGTNETLPLGACGAKINKGDSIMIDLAGNYSPWMTDMTRVFSLGKLPDLAYKAHQVSIEIQNKLMDVSKIGFSCAEMYNIALGMVQHAKLEPYFMGTDLQAKFIGHGVGLEINELPILTPKSKEILTKNTVFAIEPKFVIPGVGAVGVENTYLVTDDGIEKLTVLNEDIIEL